MICVSEDFLPAREEVVGLLGSSTPSKQCNKDNMLTLEYISTVVGMSRYW